MKNIVVSGDLSERSRPALARAVRLAVEHDAALAILHVVDDALPSAVKERIAEEARVYLSQEAAAVIGKQRLRYEIEVIAGDAIDAIAGFARASKADLLVVGRHRHRAFLDQFRRTTVEHVITASDVPVLLVTGPSDEPYGHILGGLDLTEVCATALTKARLLAPEARLTLFHAHEVSFRKEAENEFDTWKSVYPVPFDLPDPIFMEASPSHALRDVMTEGTYDLLVIGTHPRTSAGRYLFGDFSARLIRNPPCDLLIAR